MFLLFQPVFGMLSGKIGRKPMMITFGLFFVFATVPLLGSLQPSFTSPLFVQLTGLCCDAAWSSVSSAVAAELLPARLRDDFW